MKTLIISLIISFSLGTLPVVIHAQKKPCPCEGPKDTIPPPPILPIHILRFDVSLASNDAQLSWQTNSDPNFTHFEVERSQNGDTWNRIGKVQGNSGAATVNNYRYTDSNITSLGVNVVYYRLRNMYKNGVAAYTMIRTLNISNAMKGRITVWYNASNNTVQITIPAVNTETMGDFAIMANDGKLVLKKTALLAKGNNELHAESSG